MQISPTRRSLIKAGFAFSAAHALPAWATEPPHSVITVSDFDERVGDVEERLAVLEARQS